MVSKSLNTIELFNEIFVLVFGYFLFLFTDLVDDKETRYFFGDILMYLLLGVIVINSCIVLFIMTLNVFNLGRRHLKRYKYRKELREKADN